MAVNNTSVEKLSYEKVLDVLQECRDEGEEIALVVSTADELTKPNSLLYREDLERYVLELLGLDAYWVAVLAKRWEMPLESDA